jgi:hypothetical protein
MHRFFQGKPRTLLVSLCVLVCTQAIGAASIEWPQPPSRLDLATPYGTLGITTSDYVYESRLHVNNTELAPKIEGLLNITYAFALPSSQAALVSISDGSEHCPVRYRWIILHHDGYKVSPAFGSCSEHIKVSVAGTKFTLQTPNNEKPDKIDTYVYDGQTIKQRTK